MRGILSTGMPTPEDVEEAAARLDDLFCNDQS